MKSIDLLFFLVLLSVYQSLYTILFCTTSASFSDLHEIEYETDNVDKHPSSMWLVALQTLEVENNVSVLNAQSWIFLMWLILEHL